MNNTIQSRSNKIKIVASPSTWIEGETLRQLDATAELTGMKSVVGLPDAHPGKGGPNGVACLTESVIHTILVG